MHTIDGACTCHGCMNGNDEQCHGCGEVCGAAWCQRCTQLAEDAQVERDMARIAQQPVVMTDLW